MVREYPHVISKFPDKHERGIKKLPGKLQFACGQVPLPKWEHLLDRDIHMDKCKRFKIEADGRISKLDAETSPNFTHICQQLGQAKMEVISFITLS